MINVHRNIYAFYPDPIQGSPAGSRLLLFVDVSRRGGGTAMRTFALLCLAGAARAVTLNCGGLVGGSGEFVAVDDVVFTDEGVCEKTCGACSSPNGPMTCAPASGTLSEFRCAEADASGALSFAIVVTPTVDVSCEDVAGLKFEAGCAAACASCSSADAPKMCAKGV